MDRRAFVGAAAGGFVLTCTVARSQQPARVYRIGILQASTEAAVAPLIRALTEGLRELGFIEGRNFVFERRYAEGNLERLPDHAAELARLQVDVIVTGSNIHVAAAQRATATIPIVFVAAADPVAAGFVASLARPGGNITGLSANFPAIQGKNLALLKEIVPRLSRVGVLGEAMAPSGSAEIRASARKLNLALEVANIRDANDFEDAFTAMADKRVGAVIVGGGPLTYVHRQQVADWALKHRLPAIHGLREYAQAGLLLSYGTSLPDQYRRAASYVARILDGAKPGDLPVEQPVKFELVINLKTAKALGIAIPQSLLLRADEVIQ